MPLAAKGLRPGMLVTGLGPDVQAKLLGQRSLAQVEAEEIRDQQARIGVETHPRSEALLFPGQQHQIG
jgi:hypothetical protein